MRHLLLAIALIATHALADMEAVWDVEGEGKMVISFRDAQNVRMEMDEEGYLLLDEGTIYSVSQQEGQWVAMNMAEIGQMMSAMKGRGPAAPGPDDSDDDFKLVDTGRKDTVAGYKGVVYEVVPADGGPKQIAVLSDHADVMAAQKAFNAMARAMAGAMSGELPDIPDDLPGGLLRNEDIRLVSVKETKKPDGWFDLPKDVQMQTMQDIMKALGPPSP